MARWEDRAGGARAERGGKRGRGIRYEDRERDGKGWRAMAIEGFCCGNREGRERGPGGGP